MEKLIKKRKKLLEEFCNHGEMIKGSMYSICSNCSRVKCSCKNKSKKVTYRLTFKTKGQKSKIVYVPRVQVKKMKRMIKNFEYARKIMDELININIEIFKAASKIDSEKKK